MEGRTWKPVDRASSAQLDERSIDICIVGVPCGHRAAVMQELIAGFEKFSFDFEKDVECQRGSQLLPFPGMDKSGAAVCDFFIQGICKKGSTCPFRHVTGEKTVVCKHWLRGLCKKGDHCEFLHEYDMGRMPECYFYSKFGSHTLRCSDSLVCEIIFPQCCFSCHLRTALLHPHRHCCICDGKTHLDMRIRSRQRLAVFPLNTAECSNKDCPFLHIDPASKIKDCPWYDRGFCKHGPACKYRHTRRVMCTNYLVGFCPEGPRCKYAHPKVDLVLCSPDYVKNAAAPQRLPVPSIPCEPISKHATLITEIPHLSQLTVLTMIHERFQIMQENVCVGLRPLEQVTCFKCGDRGHYANKCCKNRYPVLMRK